MHGFGESQRPDVGAYVGSADINVTPFIDVVLVLLIIFMVAAPLSTVDVPLDLPDSSAQPTPPQDEPIVLSVMQDLSLRVGDTPATRDTVGVLIKAAGGRPDSRILVQADKKISYEQLMGVLDLLRKQGHTKVALLGLSAQD